MDHYLNKLEFSLVGDAFKRLTTFPATRFLRRLLKHFNIYSHVRIRPPPSKLLPHPTPGQRINSCILVNWKVMERWVNEFLCCSVIFPDRSVIIQSSFILWGIMILRTLELPYPRLFISPRLCTFSLFSQIETFLTQWYFVKGLALENKCKRIKMFRRRDKKTDRHQIEFEQSRSHDFSAQVS